MDLTTINVIRCNLVSILDFLADSFQDPAGVKALLDQLRVSQAWKDVTAAPSQNNSASTCHYEESAASTTTTAASVASLLSQLQSSPSTSSGIRDIVDQRNTPTSSDNSAPLQTVLPSPRRTKEDTRLYTFQQALPHLVQLSDDPGFVALITQVWLYVSKNVDWCGRDELCASDEERTR
jgi:hypothetical protein